MRAYMYHTQLSPQLSYGSPCRSYVNPVNPMWVSWIACGFPNHTRDPTRSVSEGEQELVCTSGFREGNVSMSYTTFYQLKWLLVLGQLLHPQSPQCQGGKIYLLLANKPCKRHYFLALRSGQKKDTRALNKDLLMENKKS